MRGYGRSRRFLLPLFQVACVLFPFPLLAAPPVQAASGTGSERTELWNLTYIHSHLASVDGTAQPPTGQATSKDNIDKLVDALNNALATEWDSNGQPKPPLHVQRAGVGRLILYGKEDQLREMEHILTLVDAPWPQVQLDLWAVQASGDDESTTEEIRWMEDRISNQRDKMVSAQEELERLANSGSETPGSAMEKAVNAGQSHSESLRKCNVLSKLHKAGLELPHAPLSLNEALVLLTLSSSSDRLGRIRRWDCFLGKIENNEAPSQARSECQEEPFANASQKSQTTHASKLHEVFATNAAEENLATFESFADALTAFGGHGAKDGPKRLSRMGTVIDRLLKLEVDAFAADMRTLFLDPLLHELQERRREKASGLALVGRTRIVVTSGLEAGMTPEMASFVETTRPKPLGKEVLDTALPATGDQARSGNPAGAMTGEARILAALAQPQALLLAAALAEPEKTFSKVAPGIGISVRPTVLPDGSAARLTIDARFGVTSSVATQPNDVFVQGTPSGISRHDVRTDAVINAFDLFDISSFDVQSVSPQAPFFVPILGRLPIIGPAFQWPRHPKVTHYSSLILVNAVILPRSLDLLRLYGDMPSGESEPLTTAGCTEERPAEATKKASMKR